MSDQVDKVLIELTELARLDAAAKIPLYKGAVNSGAVLWTRLNKIVPLPGLYIYPQLPAALRMAYTGARWMLNIYQGVK